MTPKAANFNIMPAALLETKSQNSVIKYQALFAIVLLIIYIINLLLRVLNKKITSFAGDFFDQISQ